MSGAGDRLGIAECLDAEARLAAGGDDDRAARLLAAAAALRNDVGARAWPFELARREAALASVRERLGERAFEDAATDGAAMSTEQRIALALDRGNESGAPVGAAPLPEPRVRRSALDARGEVPAGVAGREYACVRSWIAVATVNRPYTKDTFSVPVATPEPLWAMDDTNVGYNVYVRGGLVPPTFNTKVPRIGAFSVANMRAGDVLSMFLTISKSCALALPAAMPPVAPP